VGSALASSGGWLEMAQSNMGEASGILSQKPLQKAPCYQNPATQTQHTVVIDNNL